MPIPLAQSGLFIVSVVFMYVAFALPTITLIAALVAMAGGGRDDRGPMPGLRWSHTLFIKTFLALAVASGAAVLAACVWASLTIGAR